MEERSQYKKGLWTEEEDKILTEYIQVHGKGQWNSIPKKTGLKRCGKSCRLRWMNYLSPGVKRGHFTDQEEDLIIRLHKLLGNRWSLIAGRVPGRTDNQVKNYWNTHLSKKLGIRKGNKRPRISSSISLGESSREGPKNPQPPSLVSTSSFSHGGCSQETSPPGGSLVLTDHPGTTDDVQNCEGGCYTMNPFWVSDFDGMMRDTPSFMELIDGHDDDDDFFCHDWNLELTN